MLKLDVTANVAKATEYLSDVAAKRIPDAAAKALTRTAFDARDAVRDGLPERFNLRRPWISRGVGVTPAKPRTLMAEVWSRDRFMALQETGGTKTGKLAIPVGPMAQTAQTRVIPKSQWPGQVMAKKNVFYRAGAVFERRDEKRILALYLLRRQQKVEPRFARCRPCQSAVRPSADGAAGTRPGYASHPGARRRHRRGRTRSSLPRVGPATGSWG